jgi:tetratricopeptide (TPR) repeat protein
VDLSTAPLWCLLTARNTGLDKFHHRSGTPALGESYFTIGKTEMALAEFKLLLQPDPSAQSYAFMGLCYRHLGKCDEAKQYLQQG